MQIADGLASDEPVKVIAARIGRIYQAVYWEIARNSKPGGRYQPWDAHGQAHLRRRRPATAGVRYTALEQLGLKRKNTRHTARHLRRIDRT
jgi:IS30 family transposase